MLTQTATSTEPRVKMFMDIPTAAEMAGFSLRHFRRIIEEDNIPIVQIGRKFFILARDLENWQMNQGTAKREVVQLSNAQEPTIFEYTERAVPASSVPFTIARPSLNKVSS